MNIKTLIAFSSIIVLYSCGSNDLESKKKALLKAKDEALKAQQKVKELEKEIASLDTTKAATEGTPVEVVQITPKTFVHTVKVQGNVEASKNIIVNPEASGRITKIYVKEGQQVSAGQTIATIDASILYQNMEELKKGLEFANTMYEKQKTLNEKGVGTEVQFLEAKNRKESLEKSMATLQSQLAKYTIKAPISGFVDDLMPKEGELAGPQMPIARIVSTDNVFVEADVTESLLGKVKEGDKVEIEFSNLNKKVNGVIIQSGQYIEPQNRTFKVKIDIKEQNSLFKPNLLAIVNLTDYSKKEAISVPSIVIQDDLKGTFVFVNENGKAVKKYIEIGISNRDETEVLSGLNANESLIIKGQKGLVQGETLSLVESIQ